MADELLAAVPHPKWRLEQVIDLVSRSSSHALSSMIATVLERANVILAEDDLVPINAESDATSSDTRPHPLAVGRSAA